MTTGVRGRLAGQFAWASGARIAAAVLQAVLLIVAARAITPAEFGLLASVLGIATVVQTALDMGVSTFVTRERAADPGSGSIATALRFNSLTSFAMAVLSLLTLVGLGLLQPIFFLLLPLAIWISAERTADVRLAIAFADGDVKINSINLIARRTAGILLFLALLFASVEPLLAYSVAVAVAAVGSSAFANFYVRSRVTARPDITYRALLRLSWPYWLHSVATQLRNLDSAITAVVAGATQAGYFSVASRLTSPLRILPTTLASVLLPHASRSDRSSMRPLAKLAGVAVLLCVLVYGVILLLVPAGLPWLLGADYIGSVPSVMIVIAGLPFAATVSLYSSLLQGAGKKHFVATVSTASSTTCLLAVGLLAWQFGAVGAATALSATFMLQAAAIVIGFVVLVQRRRQSTGESDA